MRSLTIYPGGDLVEKGFADLVQGLRTEEALLVTIAAPRLTRLGFSVPRLPNAPAFPEHALFEMLESRLDRGAHAAYNALLGRIVSFASAYRPDSL